MGQVEAGYLDQLAFRADSLEEHDQLEPEKDNGINTRTAAIGIAVRDPVADKGEIEREAGELLGPLLWPAVEQATPR